MNETEQQVPADPDYGIRTCGKLAEKPFDALGPCLRDPNHDGRCRFRAPVMKDAYVEVSKVPEGESPFDADPIIIKYQRMLRASTRIAVGCAIVNAALLVYQLLSTFEVF